MLNTPLQSTVDQTDVGMAKEDHGRMTSTEYQVLLSGLLCKISLQTTESGT